MKPSVLVSLITFIFFGYPVLAKLHLNTDNWIQIVYLCVIIFSSVYYYYLSIATEGQWKTHGYPTKYECFSWCLLTLQYLGIYLLWHLLENDFRFYALDLVFLYLTYILWDIITSKFKQKNSAKNQINTTEISPEHLEAKIRKEIKEEIQLKTLFLFDKLGLILATLLFISTFILPPEIITSNIDAHYSTIVILIGVSFIVVSILGIKKSIEVFKYNPFKRLWFSGESKHDGNPNNKII
jgi:hypothetical protein